MAGIGEAASIMGIGQALIQIKDIISSGLDNYRQTRNLLKHVEQLREQITLHTGVPQRVLDRINSELVAVKTILEPIRQPSATCFGCTGFGTCIWHGLRGSTIRGTLDKALNRFEHLKNESLFGAYVCSAATDHRVPTIANNALDLDSKSFAGFERVEALKEFLKEKEEGLRLVGIYGEPGIGKTTLLDKLWEDMKSQFAERAYVQVGHGASFESLRKLQSGILQQLGGQNMDFPSDSFGRRTLKEHLLSLRNSNKPVFLAIDNVWDEEHLTTLLPDQLASLLASSSCIVITSRQYNVIRKLLEIAPLQATDTDHVKLYTPPCLSDEASEKLFADQASMPMEDHAELIKAITRLCRGLPLALSVLGCMFRDETKRHEPEWRKVQARMEKGGIRVVQEAIALSYESLKATHRKAFLGVVGFFYGWNWKTVGSIVGEDVLQDLKDSSLIRVAENWGKCNRHQINHFGCPKSTQFAHEVVDMHDLIFNFGKNLLEEEKPLRKIVQDDTEDSRATESFRGVERHGQFTLPVSQLIGGQATKVHVKSRHSW